MDASKQSYYRLFTGYALASLGGGVAVVALSLLAFELAPEEQEAAAIIGAALSIKTLAYVAGAPIAAAFVRGLPRRPLLASLDLARAAVILTLPWVTHSWQLLALVGVFTLASAAFTPAYQASVASLLPDPADYAKSLSRSRIVGEFEGFASPLVAGALLAVLSLTGVFTVAMAAFVASAALIARARLPAPEPSPSGLARFGAGFPALFRDPALRGLVPMAVAAGAGAAAVMVETVPIVRGRFGLGGEEAAIALAVFGAGSLAGALALPRLLDRVAPRTVMLAAGALCALALGAGVAVRFYATLLALWVAVGAAVALAQAPALELIRRAVPEDRLQDVFAANISLTTAVAGLCFAAAGFLGGQASLPDATAAMAGLAAAGTLVAALLWRAALRGADAAPGAGG